MDKEEHCISKSYRLVANYKNKRVELSSNIPTIDIAGRLRSDYYARYPKFDSIVIEEYYVLFFLH